MNGDRTGFSLVQVMVAAAMVGLLSLVISSVLKQMQEGSQRAQETATVAQLRHQADPIMARLPPWLQVMKTANPSLASCIPESPTSATVFNCPAVGTILDSEISTAFAPHAIVSFALLDVFGKPLAGTEASPLLLDGRGAACATNPTACVFQSVGYFIRTTASPSADPQNVKFVYKLSRIPNAQKIVPMKPVVVEISVGQIWKTPTTLTLPACTTGQMMVSNGAGGFTCSAVPSVTLPSCSVGQTIKVNSSGNYACADLPDIPNCGPGKILVKSMTATSRAYECKGPDFAITFHSVTTSCPSTDVKVACPAGSKVIGGGYEQTDDCGSAQERIITSAPNNSRTEWWIYAVHSRGIAYAVCIKD